METLLPLMTVFIAIVILMIIIRAKTGSDHLSFKSESRYGKGGEIRCNDERFVQSTTELR